LPDDRRQKTEDGGQKTEMFEVGIRNGEERSRNADWGMWKYSILDFEF